MPRKPANKTRSQSRDAEKRRRERRKRRSKAKQETKPVRRFLLGTTLVVGAIGLLTALAVAFHYHRMALRYDVEAVSRVPQPSTVLDGSDRILTLLNGEEVGTPVDLSIISPHFITALIAREDSRFFKHHGIDHIGLMRAWLRNARENRKKEGGSTITMQLTRMTFGLSGKTIERKLLEMAIARRIESRYSKEEILSFYVNRVYLGTGMNGIEQAARGYFGKSSADLTLPESAMLAGIIRAPNGFSPFRQYESALREMRTTFIRMADEGVLASERLESYLAARPPVLPQEQWMAQLRRNRIVSSQGYIEQMIQNEVSNLVPSHARAGGLTIRTTFDTALQAQAEQALNLHLGHLESQPGYEHPTPAMHQSGETAYLQGAVTVIENNTGALRVLVGGRNFADSAFNRATQARRPIGSVFKPLVYGTAFERGLFPGTWVSDAAIAPGEIPWDVTGWSPENADNNYGGPLPASDGLIQSRNTMTVRVGEFAGLDAVLNMMDLAGVAPAAETIESATVYLGTVEANVRAVASAYSIFANGGIRHQPYFIESIVDREGTTLYRHADVPYEVMSAGAAWMTSNLLQQVLEQGGTGANLRHLGFDAPAGGKTGTTNDFRDAWFAGYTSRLSGAVWIGLDQPAPIAKGAYGGRTAMPIWKDIFAAAAELGYQSGPFRAPVDINRMNLCRESGLMSTETCEHKQTVYIENVPYDLIPREFCDHH
ncbi:MAG: transglycosylase domain-containing protein [Verrucomicrobiota bacterium]